MLSHSHSLSSPSRSFARARSIFACVALLACAAALGGCAKKGGAGGPGGKGGFQMPPTPVETATVATAQLADRFVAVGSLEARDVVDITTQIAAPVRAFHFTEGGHVSQGAVLVDLFSDDRKAQSDRAAALVDQAKAERDRAEQLHKQDAVSTSVWEGANAAYHVAAANDAVARVEWQKTQIRAPFSGSVGVRKVSPGAYVRPGDLIVQLARTDVMKVTCDAPERYVGALHIGDAVHLTTAAFPRLTFYGRITVVDPLIDPNTRTVHVVAQVPNGDGRLKPGMSANVAVTLAERPNALVVPDEAVFAEGAQTFVYVVKPEGTVSKTAITLGTRDESRAEVLSGLSAGQIVVSAGHQKLYDGAKVMPLPAGGATPPSPAPAAVHAAKGGTAR